MNTLCPCSRHDIAQLVPSSADYCLQRFRKGASFNKKLSFTFTLYWIYGRDYCKVLSCDTNGCKRSYSSKILADRLNDFRSENRTKS